MKRILALVMAIAAALGACGCQSSSEPEHEAYAISLSLDISDEGLLTVGVQIPTLGAGDSSDESSGKSSYQTYTAASRTFPEALDLLMATIPARLVLAHLKSVVVSEKLASGPDFGILISDMIQTYQLYGSSVLIVSKGEALKFIKAQKPAIGKRFSTSFTATIQHYGDIGYVPMTTLYEVYAAMHSIYSDPILTYAATSEKKDGDSDDTSGSGGGGGGKSSPAQSQYGQGENAPDAAGLPMDAGAGELARTGPDQNEFMGCALTRDGSVVGTLNGTQTALLEFINGRISDMSFYSSDIAMRLKNGGHTRFSVDCKGSEPIISLEMGVYVSAMSDITDLTVVERQLADDAARLIEKAQGLGVEPFFISEKAARQFATIDDFLRYGFRDKFCRARVEVTVTAKREKSG